MAFLFSRLIRYVLVAYLLFAGTQYLLRWKSYTFSPKEFRALAEKSKGDSVMAVQRFTSDLRRQFGPLVASDLSWVAFSAGGMSLRAQIVAASLTEFIVAFNAPLATSGRSGFHYANVSCTVLSGTVKRIVDKDFLSDGVETFTAGQNFRHGQFETGTYSLNEKTYLLCYGRGVVPLSGLGWLLPSAVLNGDFVAAGKLIYLYGRATLEATIHSTQATVNHYSNKYFKTEL